MNLLDLKEKISRVRFFIDRIRYKRKRHFYLIVPGFIFLIAAVFLIIFVNQQLEIKRKDNILRSYYSGNGTGIIKLESAGSTADEIELMQEEKENIKSGNTEDLEETGDYEGRLNENGIIKVYICGEVRNPGVYDIENGARVIDLLEIAGGEGKDACLEIINLAETVFDGQRIYIPSLEEISSSNFLFFGSDYQENRNYAESRTININNAGLTELESLPGIGPVTANNIIEYRNKTGLFKAKEEIKNVTGIGEKKYEKIKKYISI